MLLGKTTAILKTLPLILFVLATVGFSIFIVNIILSGWSFNHISAVVYSSVFSFALGFSSSRLFSKAKAN